MAALSTRFDRFGSRHNVADVNQFAFDGILGGRRRPFELQSNTAGLPNANQCIIAAARAERLHQFVKVQSFFAS